MKPSKFFWPLSLLFGAGIRFKNLLFDKGIISSKEFDVPVICIGNLAAGGTGKTPMVIKVVEMLLHAGMKPVILSRGYKRNSADIKLITDNSSVTETGDEPMLLFKYFRNVPVILSGNRIKGIKYILQQFPETNVVVMDDGFQHRWVKPTMNILLSAFQNPFTSDQLLPAGYLREPASAAIRAQLIVVTKTPEHTSRETKQNLFSLIKKHSNAPVIFSTLSYNPLKHVFTEETFHESPGGYHCLTVSGISDDETFTDYIRRHALKTESISFPNHHPYSSEDAEMIARRFNNIAAQRKIIITTGKDAVKLMRFKELQSLPLYQLPVVPDFLPEEKELLKTELIKHARKN